MRLLEFTNNLSGEVLYAHVVALAVADGVQAVVEQLVVPREAVDGVRAPVVLLAAAVRRQDAAIRLPVGRRHVPGPAPPSAGQDEAHAPASSTSHLDRPGPLVLRH